MPASSVDCKLLNLESVRQAVLQSEPYDYAIAPDVLDKGSGQAISRDFPAIKGGGSFPIDVLTYGATFDQLCRELLSKEFEQIVAEKFNLELSGLPTLLTARGYARWSGDGHIHTDSKDKVITVLLYLTDEWTQPGGRLRVLRGKALADYAAEIPPTMGQMLLFRRCDYSWHGHEPCEGQRRSLQLNWVKSARYQKFEGFRHKLSSFLKGAKEY